VFIPTYNESEDILRRTMAGAIRIDHTNKVVWLLDDGDRSAMAQLAHEFGVRYVTRPVHNHAKAGNLNHGFTVARQQGRGNGFCLILDADFIAVPKIVKRVLPLLLADPRVGCVQTPQHFFNEDPIQQNLMCGKVWPDEQRFFFNSLLPCKDAWDTAFCCGTGVMFRMAALEANGGMATQTVTEDMLTTFQLSEHGFRTIFLNEPLSYGLAPDNLIEYMKQRSRWCLGAVQQLRSKWSFFGSARLSLINRISMIDIGLFWLFSFPFRLMMIAAPIIYWWTGTAVINATIPGLLIWLAPSLAADITFMSCYGKGRVMPIMNDVNHLSAAWMISKSAWTGLVNNKPAKFRVTEKGGDRNRRGLRVHWHIVLLMAGLISLTLGGILINANDFSSAASNPGYPVNVFWSVVNVIVMMLTATVAVELPQQRQNVRVHLPKGQNLVPVLDRDTQGAGVADIIDISLDSIFFSSTIPIVKGRYFIFNITNESGRVFQVNGEVKIKKKQGYVAHIENNTIDSFANLVTTLYRSETIIAIPDVSLFSVAAAVLRRIFSAKT
jgi:cellulose synthase (UDP-forming)